MKNYVDLPENIVKKCLNALNIRDACHVYTAKCVSKMKSILYGILLWEYLYFILLSSSNQEYKLLTIV